MLPFPDSWLNAAPPGAENGANAPPYYTFAVQEPFKNAVQQCGLNDNKLLPGLYQMQTTPLPDGYQTPTYPFVSGLDALADNQLPFFAPDDVGPFFGDVTMFQGGEERLGTVSTQEQLGTVPSATDKRLTPPVNFPAMPNLYGLPQLAKAPALPPVDIASYFDQQPALPSPYGFPVAPPQLNPLHFKQFEVQAPPLPSDLPLVPKGQPSIREKLEQINKQQQRLLVQYQQLEQYKMKLLQSEQQSRQAEDWQRMSAQFPLHSPGLGTPGFPAAALLDGKVLPQLCNANVGAASQQAGLLPNLTGPVPQLPSSQYPITAYAAQVMQHSQLARSQVQFRPGLGFPFPNVDPALFSEPIATCTAQQLQPQSVAASQMLFTQPPGPGLVNPLVKTEPPSVPETKPRQVPSSAPSGDTNQVAQGWNSPAPQIGTLNNSHLTSKLGAHHTNDLSVGSSSGFKLAVGGVDLDTDYTVPTNVSDATLVLEHQPQGKSALPPAPNRAVDVLPETGHVKEQRNSARPAAAVVDKGDGSQPRDVKAKTQAFQDIHKAKTCTKASKRSRIPRQDGNADELLTKVKRQIGLLDLNVRNRIKDTLYGFCNSLSLTGSDGATSLDLQQQAVLMTLSNILQENRTKQPGGEQPNDMTIGEHTDSRTANGHTTADAQLALN